MLLMQMTWTRRVLLDAHDLNTHESCCSSTRLVLNKHTMRTRVVVLMQTILAAEAHDLC